MSAGNKSFGGVHLFFSFLLLLLRLGLSWEKVEGCPLRVSLTVNWTWSRIWCSRRRETYLSWLPWVRRLVIRHFIVHYHSFETYPRTVGRCRVGITWNNSEFMRRRRGEGTEEASSRGIYLAEEGWTLEARILISWSPLGMTMKASICTNWCHLEERWRTELSVERILWAFRKRLSGCRQATVRLNVCRWGDNGGFFFGHVWKEKDCGRKWRRKWCAFLLLAFVKNLPSKVSRVTLYDRWSPL